MDQILENDASEKLKTTDIIAGESNKMDKIEDEIQTNSAMHTQRRIHLITKRNLQEEKIGLLLLLLQTLTFLPSKT